MSRPMLITPEGYAALTTYLAQWEAHAADPEQAPEPDHTLATVEASYWRNLGREVGTDPRDGATIIGVTYGSRTGPRNVRWFDPLDAVAFGLALGFRSGININDATARPVGNAYAKYRANLNFLGTHLNYSIDLLRILANAGPDMVVKQLMGDGTRPDYHFMRRGDLTIVTRQSVQAQGKAIGKPERGRPEFYAAVAHYHRCYGPRSGIPVTTEQHVANVRRALELQDRLHRNAARGLPEAAE